MQNSPRPILLSLNSKLLEAPLPHALSLLKAPVISGWGTRGRCKVNDKPNVFICFEFQEDQKPLCILQNWMTDDSAAVHYIINWAQFRGDKKLCQGCLTMDLCINVFLNTDMRRTSPSWFACRRFYVHRVGQKAWIQYPVFQLSSKTTFLTAKKLIAMPTSMRICCTILDLIRAANCVINPNNNPTTV